MKRIILHGKRWEYGVIISSIGQTTHYYFKDNILEIRKGFSQISYIADNI